MSQIRADQRQILYKANPKALAEADRLCRRLHEDQIALAKVLETTHETAAYFGEQAGSIGELVLRRGLSPMQGWALRLVGHAMVAFPWVEARLRDGSLTFDHPHHPRGARRLQARPGAGLAQGGAEADPR